MNSLQEEGYQNGPVSKLFQPTSLALCELSLHAFQDTLTPVEDPGFHALYRILKMTLQNHMCIFTPFHVSNGVKDGLQW